MTGLQISLNELCISCDHNNNDCFKKKLWDGLGIADGSHYCSNHLPKKEEDTE